MPKGAQIIMELMASTQADVRGYLSKLHRYNYVYFECIARLYCRLVAFRFIHIRQGYVKKMIARLVDTKWSYCRGLLHTLH